MTTPKATDIDLMNIVIIGHVDHGKSTVIGRLLADTGALPEGKLEQVKATCERNAKPFEYAFLLDALKDEQTQGITIDSARCFFKSDTRHYIIIDAPGHIEFLKNMISGASRAEAAILVIDAKEGVQENSRRHGYMASMLGIKQLVVLVNKMDLVAYDQATFEKIKSEYTQFLTDINVHPVGFIPVSAFEGKNLITLANEMPWYEGASLLNVMDSFQKAPEKYDQPFRLPVQDIYKFTEDKDDRRIIVGTIETGSLSKGEEVIFLPSQKVSKIKRIEAFNSSNPKTVYAGQAIGVTLDTELYLKPGEVMVKIDEQSAQIGDTFRANIFWLSKNPMVKNKKYKLKCAASRVSVYLKDIVNVMDASNLNKDDTKNSIGRHDVAECIFQTRHPISFDLSSEFEATGRFVIVDEYEIAGGGSIAENISQEDSWIDTLIKKRDASWILSDITTDDRKGRYHQKPKFIVITGPQETGKITLAKALERDLHKSGRSIFYLGLSNHLSGLTNPAHADDREEFLRRLGELGHILSHAGLILISTISDLDEEEIEVLKQLTKPYDFLLISVSNDTAKFAHFDLELEANGDTDAQVKKIKEVLYDKSVLLDYYL